jgi:hypothetical protein
MDVSEDEVESSEGENLYLNMVVNDRLPNAGTSKGKAESKPHANTGAGKKGG